MAYIYIYVYVATLQYILPIEYQFPCPQRIDICWLIIQTVHSVIYNCDMSQGQYIEIKRFILPRNIRLIMDKQLLMLPSVLPGNTQIHAHTNYLHLGPGSF